LRNARCDAVILGSLPGVTGKVLGAGAQLGFEPRWIAQSPAWHSTLLDSPLRDYYTRHLWLMSPGTEWGDPMAAGMAEMIEAIAEFDPNQKPDFYASTGYVLGMTARGLLEEAIARGDLSRTGLLQAMVSLKTIPYQGLVPEYSYGPVATRQPPLAVCIFRIDPEGPWGVRMIARDYVSPAAAKFSF
jgi:hypothetical protein